MKNRHAFSAASLALSGMTAALVFVATYAIRLPALTHGYIHLGDGFILLGAALLGPAAVPAAAVGSMLADLFAGYTIYCLPTFLIKGAAAAIAVAGLWKDRPLWVKLASMIAAEAVMVAGYFLAEWLVLGYGLAAAVSAVAPNVVQGVSGVLLGAVLLPLVVRIRKIWHL